MNTLFTGELDLLRQFDKLDMIPAQPMYKNRLALLLLVVIVFFLILRTTVWIFLRAFRTSKGRIRR